LQARVTVESHEIGVKGGPEIDKMWQWNIKIWKLFQWVRRICGT